MPSCFESLHLSCHLQQLLLPPPLDADCWCICTQNANVGSYKQEGFVEVLAATQSPRSTAWFQGTADAVRQYIWLFENAMRNGVEDLLILSGED